jgi:hypothetical protein
MICQAEYSIPFALLSTYTHFRETRSALLFLKLPTPEMRQRVIPEGVVNSGGNLDGWLFFEKVEDENLDRVMFRADLVDAETGKKFAEVRIPFLVE